MIEILSTVSEVSVPTEVRLDAVIPLARVVPVSEDAAATKSEPTNFPLEPSNCIISVSYTHLTLPTKRIV